MKFVAMSCQCRIVVGCILFVFTLPMHALSRPLSEVTEQAKMATVGILRHTDDTSYKSVHSQFSIRGSGVQLGDGYVLTARHVVERQDGGKIQIPSSIRVLTTRFGEWRAELVGANRFLDLALYRVQSGGKESELASVVFGTKEPLQGDDVFTVGYPLGWGPALAFGKLGNPQTFLPTGQSRLMQVDLSACSGNSGGGLFDSHGNLVGLIHAIIQSEANESERRCSRFGFAIPGSLVQKIVESLKDGKPLAFPKLGIRMTVVKINQQWRVAVAKAKGPSRRAGIRKNDVIFAIDQNPVTSAAQLKSYLIEHTTPGQTIELQILRGEKFKIVKIILGKA